MTAAAKSELFARTEVQQFVGYALWGVWLTTSSKQHCDDSVKTYGRSDTVEQAWGMVASLVNDIPLDCLRCDGGMWSWRDARTAIRQTGRKPRVVRVFNRAESRVSRGRYTVYTELFNAQSRALAS